MKGRQSGGCEHRVVTLSALFPGLPSLQHPLQRSTLKSTAIIQTLIPPPKRKTSFTTYSGSCVDIFACVLSHCDDAKEEM